MDKTNIIENSIGVGELIGRYLSDPLIEMPDDLKAWLDESTANREFFEKAVKGTNIAQNLRNFEKIDTGWEWKRFGSRLRINRIRKTALISIANAAVILATVLIFRPTGDKVVAESLGTIVSVVDSEGNEFTLSDENYRVNIGTGGCCLIRNHDRITVGGSDVSSADDAAEPRLITVRIPRGGEYQLTLPDGTTVWLGAETSLTFPDRFGYGPRNVKIAGEGNFSVTHDEHRPFIVGCGEVSVTVLGTIFHIYGFGDDNTVTTTLIEGSISQSVAGTDRQIILNPSRQAVYSREKGTVTVREVDTSDIQAYRDGKLVFRDVPLREIVTQLERSFDCTIKIEGDVSPDEHYHLIVDKKNGIDPVLTRLRKSGGFSYEKSGKTIRIY